MNPSNLNLPNLHHWQEAETAGPDGLLPCAHCGKPLPTDPFPIIHTEDYYAYIVCRNCGACGPAIEVFSGGGSSRDKAVAAWNTRATDALARREPALLAAIAGVAEVLEADHHPLCENPCVCGYAQRKEAALANLNAALARE